MKKKLGEILVTSGAVTAADIEAALSDQSAGEPNRLGDLLVANGKLSSAALARALGEQHGLPFVELPALPQAVLDLVPLELQRQFRFVPLRSEGTELFIAMADLANVEVLAVLEQQWTAVHVHVAAGEEIDALHATLSGLFAVPDDAPPAPRGGLGDDLFAAFDLGPEAPVASTPSPVPAIPRVPARPAAAPKAEDLFGDLNLESARTGIPARPPEEPAREAELFGDLNLEPAPEAAPPEEPAREEALFGDLNLEPAPAAAAEEAPVSGAALFDGVNLEPSAEPEAGGEPAPEPPPAEVFPEGSGPILEGVREGTGPLLDMLAREGTGPVVDTPFFRDAVGALVPSMADAPFPASSPSRLSAVAIAPPESPASPPRPAPIHSSPSVEALPDWLKGEAATPLAPAELPAAGAPQAWTGALDHLMPSRLVVGLTRALLARGLVTEEEILAALGQKK